MPTTTRSRAGSPSTCPTLRTARLFEIGSGRGRPQRSERVAAVGGNDVRRSRDEELVPAVTLDVGHRQGQRVVCREDRPEIRLMGHAIDTGQDPTEGLSGRDAELQLGIVVDLERLGSHHEALGRRPRIATELHGTRASIQEQRRPARLEVDLPLARRGDLRGPVRVEIGQRESGERPCDRPLHHLDLVGRRVDRLEGRIIDRGDDDLRRRVRVEVSDGDFGIGRLLDRRRPEVGPVERRDRDQGGARLRVPHHGEPVGAEVADRGAEQGDPVAPPEHRVAPRIASLDEGGLVVADQDVVQAVAVRIGEPDIRAESREETPVDVPRRAVEQEPPQRIAPDRDLERRIGVGLAGLELVAAETVAGDPRSSRLVVENEEIGRVARHQLPPRLAVHVRDDDRSDVVGRQRNAPQMDLRRGIENLRGARRPDDHGIGCTRNVRQSQQLNFGAERAPLLLKRAVLVSENEPIAVVVVRQVIVGLAEHQHVVVAVAVEVRELERRRVREQGAVGPGPGPFQLERRSGRRRPSHRGACREKGDRRSEEVLPESRRHLRRIVAA